jgi:Protein of unknown function (DUF2778)
MGFWGTRLLGAAALVATGGPLVHVGMRAISAGIAAVGVGFTLGFLGTYGVGPANAGLGSVLARISVFGTVDRGSSDLRQPLGSQARGMQLASLETTFVPASADVESDPPASAQRRGSFIERFLVDQRLDSFEERFAGAAVSPVRVSVRTAEMEDGADNLRLTSPDPGGRAIALPAVARSASKLAPVAQSPLAGAAKKRVRTADLSKEWTSPADADSHTAIYDIVAHVVYLPNGRRLEAHSGLGGYMDDPRYINAKGRGPTPPNVYDLTLREELFHGVRAIRLTPVDDGKMFGRDGILAHTYMLGPNGQSNGCVSFSDYQAFLNAYLNGEINRIVVVEHLANGPGLDAGPGWFAEVFKGLFGRS